MVHVQQEAVSYCPLMTLEKSIQYDDSCGKINRGTFPLYRDLLKVAQL